MWNELNQTCLSHSTWTECEANEMMYGNEASLIAALQLKHRRSCFHKHDILQEPGLNVASTLQEKRGQIHPWGQAENETIRAVNGRSRCHVSGGETQTWSHSPCRNTSQI